jgi:DNA invertase Pin-like site-specific DNA recombinase
MSKVIAYIRASTNKQELDHQKLAVLEFAMKRGMHIHEDDIIELIVSSRRCSKQRRIDELLETLKDDVDTLIVSELSRLGRSTAEVISLVNNLVDRNIRVIAVKQGLDISKHDLNSKMSLHLFSLLSELERDLISLRTKEALAFKKSKGQILGRKKGTIGKSKYDKDKEKIIELLGYGVPLPKILRFLGYGRYESLETYIKKRKLKQKIETPRLTGTNGTNGERNANGV